VKSRPRVRHCLLDLCRTVGVDTLMDGLSVHVLNEGEIESDCAARLAYERGRLPFYAGHMRQAVQLLQSVAKQIAARDPNGPIRLAAIQKLILTAQAVEAARHTAEE
jgi:hypothetical protein